MFRHYYTSALRNLVKNRRFTVINIIGLSLSLAIFLAISGYVGYHFSFDKFYPEGDRIYRINYHEYQQGQPVLQSARSHDRTALLVHEYVPQVEAVARAYNEKAFVFTEDVRIVDQDMLFADSSFLKVFPLEVIRGDAETALVPPHSGMMSESQARVYFGDQDPIGKILYFNEHLVFTITGVFKDIPTTSSLYFNFLLSWSTIPYNGWAPKDGTFNSPWTFTFVRLNKNANDIAAINDQLSRMAQEHITHLPIRGHTGRYELQSYEGLHTAPGLSGEIMPGISKPLLYALLSLGIFVMIAAWINFINLSIARILERADEIGVRKVFGASRTAISGQFLMEATILSVITFVAGYGLFLLLSGPGTTYLSGIVFLKPSLGTSLLYLSVFIIATALFAFYPAHFISRYKPVLILKNKLGTGRGRVNLLHQGLMVFQMFLAVAVVGITLIAERQISFMQTFDAGFDANATITLRAPASTNSDSIRYTRYLAFRSEVLQQAGFISGASSFNVPGQEIRFHDEGVHAVGSSNEKKQSYWVMWIDDGYEETFGMSLLGGRNFREKESGRTCIINETAARALGYDDPLTAVNTDLITKEQERYTIIGVWKDYHHESIRKSIDPIIFFHRHPFEYGYYSFKVGSRQGDYLDRLRTVWAKHYPHDQFVYYFMDNFFAAQYAGDQLFGKLLSMFSIIAITVASLGLFGMASLAMVKRTKEIAVRKVLGASVPNLLLMLSGNYIKLIVLSCAIAFPSAYYVTHYWLEGFVYKITIEWWMIVLPGLVILLTMLLTIAGQSIRAALANPAQSLRNE